MTAGYLASATLPIEKGIKTGSNASMIVTIGLMAYLVVVGPTVYIFNNFFNATGIYLQNFPTMSLWLDPVAQDRLAGELDDLLLGLVDRLGAVRRHLHRQDLEGPLGAGVRACRACSPRLCSA